MLGQNICSRKQPLMQARNAAKAEAQPPGNGLLRHTIDQTQSQRLEHEALAQRQMQVVQAHIDFMQARRAHPVGQAFESLGRFQQGHHRAAAA